MRLELLLVAAQLVVASSAGAVDPIGGAVTYSLSGSETPTVPGKVGSDSLSPFTQSDIQPGLLDPDVTDVPVADCPRCGLVSPRGGRSPRPGPAPPWKPRSEFNQAIMAGQGSQLRGQ